MAGKVITREWTSRGPTGRKVRHVAYGYDVTINGKRERKFSSEWTSEAQALEELVKRLKNAEAGTAAPVDRTLGELVEEYLRYKGNSGKRSLRDDTCILKKRILPTFGPELPARKLTAPAIAQYERDRLGKVTPYRVANELTVLRHMLRLAKKWGYLAAVPDIELPKKPEGRLRFLDEDEIARLLKASTVAKGRGAARNRLLAPAVVLALNTGMRKDELLGLTWERVDLAADFGLSARLTLYKTKSGKPRGIPLNQDAIAALEAVEPEPEKRTGLVFTRGDLRTSFENAVARAGIPNFRFHDLRHTFASHFMMRSGNLYDLKEILGHSDIKMTMRYAHLSPHHLHGSIAKVEGLTRVRPTAHETAQSAPAAVEIGRGEV
jgi:integrase